MDDIKKFKQFLEDARLGDNSRIIGDDKNDIFRMFKNGQQSNFVIDSELISHGENGKFSIEWFDDPDHSIIKRIMDRAKSFKKISEFNEYIIHIIPKIKDMKC